MGETGQQGAHADLKTMCSSSGSTLKYSVGVVRTQHAGIWSPEQCNSQARGWGYTPNLTLCVCVCLHDTCCRRLLRPEEGNGCGRWEQNSGLLEEQQVLWTTESSVQPCTDHLESLICPSWGRKKDFMCFRSRPCRYRDTTVLPTQNMCSGMAHFDHQLDWIWEN